jgi:exodeoxyribonuclease-3
MSPAGPAPERLRVATWNVNSLRARLVHVERFIDRCRPDVLLLQETKTSAVPLAAESSLADRGYGIVSVGDGGYNGVAIAARHPLVDVARSGEFGDPALDREPRVITAVIKDPERLRFTSAYVPHGRELGHAQFRYKLDFLAALTDHSRAWQQGGPLVLGGDLNVAATDHDVFHPNAFVGSTHVSADERTALRELLSSGLVDVDVLRWGDRSRRFTWWNYGVGYTRNLGMRIDVIAVTQALADRLDTTWIDHRERSSDRPSDHAALIADLHRG